MTRFARPATEAGVIEPRTGASPDRPSRHSGIARLLGAAGMIVLTGVLYWLLTDASFRVSASSVVFEGLRYADETAVLDHLSGLEREPNIFRVRASEIASDLLVLPEVASAAATVTLPARVSVRIEERVPVFTWQDGETAWLIDEAGMLFAPVPLGAADLSDGSDTAAVPAASPQSDLSALPGSSPSASPDPGPSAPPVTAALSADAEAALPVVVDSRLPAAPPAIGTFLPADDVAVIRQLLALTPASLGSRAATLQLRVDEYDGYILSSDRGWQAVFGHYTPTLQPPSVVPRQVQCLRWLLAAEEKRLERVRLAVSDDGCGTFTLFGQPERPRQPSP